MNSTWNEEFAGRYRRHEAELRWLYLDLYHNDTGAYNYFADMLYRCWEERPEALKALDRAREENPGWYRDRGMIGMQLYVQGFAGTLKGVRKKLNYIAECGADFIHLMPLLESPAGRSDGGYAVSDYRKVRPELGTMDDLAALAEDCRGRGISVCLDFVLNHTSEDHEWAKRAKAGEKEFQDRYFFYDNWEIPNAYEQSKIQVFPATAPGSFTRCEEADKVVMTTFHPYQWDLNYMHPTVFNDMADNMLFLCNHGADIIRLDAVPYIWKALGTACRDLPQVHTLVRMLRMAVDIVCPGTLLLGEAVTDPEKMPEYFGSRDKPECHMLYNTDAAAAAWNAVATKDVRHLAHRLGLAMARPRENTFLNYIRCHDDITWTLDYDFMARFGWQEGPHRQYLNDYMTGSYPGSPARGELYNQDPREGDARVCGTTASLCGIESARESGNEQALANAVNLDIMLHALLFTLSGVPMIYGGDEIARENDYHYHGDPLKREDARNLQRGSMDWEKAKNRKKKSTPEGKIFSAIRRLEEVRAERCLFDAGADTWLFDTGNNHVLGFGRYYRGEKLLALFNFSGLEETAWVIDPEPYTDLMTGEKQDLGMLRLPAGSFRWLFHNFNA